MELFAIIIFIAWMIGGRKAARKTASTIGQLILLVIVLIVVAVSDIPKPIIGPITTTEATP